MFDLLNSELFRMAKRAQSWILLAVCAALSALVYFGFTFAARFTSGEDGDIMKEDATFSEFTTFAIPMGLGFFSGIMLIIIAANLMGNEYSWNTLRPLVARARSRASILTAKLMSLLIYAVLFTLAMVAIMVVFVFIGSAIVGKPAGFSLEILGDGLVKSLELGYTNLPYMAFAFMAATVFRSNAAGIAGALGLTFIEQPIWMLLGLASDVFDRIQEYGIAHNASQVLNDGIVDSPKATLILAVYTTLLIAIPYVVFTRRDVTSG